MGGISGQGTPSATLLIGSTPISVQITTENACGTNTFNSQSFSTTNAPPAAPSNITTPNGLCLSIATGDSTDVLFTAAQVLGVQDYMWNWSSNVKLGAQQNGTGQYLQSIVLRIPNNATSLTVSVYTYENPCGDSKVETVTFTPNHKPGVSVSSSTICQGATGTLTANAASVTYAWSTGATTSSISESNNNIYTVTVTNSSGCTSSASGSLTINPVPIATATNNNQTICTGTTFQTMVLGTSNSVANTTFGWSRNNTVNVTGIGTSGTGNITGAVLSLANNITTPQTVIFTITPTGPTPTFCQGNPITATVTVYPNPVNGTAVDPTICYGNSGSVNLTGNYSGTIQWQESTDNGGNNNDWANVTGGSGYNSATYTTPDLTETTYYRVELTTNAVCASIFTNSAKVTVNPASVGGTANAYPAAVCTGFTSQITLSNSTGAIQWQQSTDGGYTWSNVTTGIRGHICDIHNCSLVSNNFFQGRSKKRSLSCLLFYICNSDN